MKYVPLVVHAERDGNGTGPREWMGAWRECADLGWRPDKSKPKVVKDYRGDRVTHDHWLDPETGRSVKGLKRVYGIVYRRWYERDLPKQDKPDETASPSAP